MGLNFEELQSLEQRRKEQEAAKDRRAEIDRLKMFSELVYRIDAGEKVSSEEILNELQKCGHSSADLHQQLDLLAERRRAAEVFRTATPNRTSEEVYEEKMRICNGIQEANRNWKKRMVELGEEAEHIRRGDYQGKEEHEFVLKTFNQVVMRPEQLEALRAGKTIPRDPEFEDLCSELKYEDPTATRPPE